MINPTVLVVEDNPVTRKMLRVTLESQGCVVREASDGSSALSQLDGTLDLVVQDLLLPDIDGFDLREQIRARPGCELTPVIAVSGHTQRLFGPGADDAGFQDRLRKPVEPSRLLGAVRALLPEAESGQVPRPARVVVADDTDIQRKLTVLRLRDSGFEVLDAPDGVVALELVRRERPDIVLTDVLMPGLDGFELCRAIRADPDIADTPVVLASSVFIEKEDRELARRAGANGFVTREPDHRSIIDTLSHALGAAQNMINATAETPVDVVATDYDALHAQRLGRALVHESAAHTALESELAQRDAQLAVLTGISQTLARAGDPAAVIEEILARCLEATGVTGAIYRPAADGANQDEGVTLGAPPELTEQDLRDAASSQDVVVREDGIVIGLHNEGHELGVVVLGTPGVPLTNNQVVLCRAVALQLCQAVALARTQAELVASRDETVARLARAIEMRDGDTNDHNERMSVSCGIVAARLGLPEERCELLRVASAMHDIGKVATPDAILFKRGPLTHEERTEIQRHAEVGHMILTGSGSKLLELAATIALNHHERWDGGGYPRGLKGEEIPLEGRIAAVADVFDALTCERPYRPAMSFEDATAILCAGRGTHFDPVVLDAFLDAIDDIAAATGAGAASAG
jgi:response regulator RpfG family c-di-GMP phosphodiesterase